MSTPLPAPAQLLVDAARAAPSADNSQPWRFVWRSPALEVHYRETEAQRLLMPIDHPATLLAFGALLENLNQAAAAMQMPGCESSEAMVREGAWIRMPVGPGITTPREPRSLALFDRHTNRFAFASAAVRRNDLDAATHHSQGAARCIVVDDPLQRRAMADIARKASEARFRTREIHEWLNANLRFTLSEVARGDGLDVRTLGLPPGGEHLLRFLAPWPRMQRLNAVGAYKLLARIEAKPLAAAPILVAIAAPAGFRSTIDAGRLLERVWIELNARGLAVQPYFVVTDQMHRLSRDAVPEELAAGVRALRAEVTDVLQLGPDEQLMMLLRVGVPGTDAPRSKRLPLEEVLSIA